MSCSSCAASAPADGARRPLCCGRTFLAVGLVEEARREAERSLAALAPLLARGIPVVGLEPSCVLGFRDEVPALVKGEDARRLAENALLFEEFLAHEADAQGVTVFRPDHGADTGPIVLRVRCDIGPDDTPASLYHDKLVPVGVHSLLAAVAAVASKCAARIEQDSLGLVET